MENDQTGGTSGLRGYEYQILVTVWLGLKLMVEDRVCGSLEIEPASQEDIQAKLKVPVEKSTGLVALKLDGVELDIQVKSRTGAVWNSSSFGDVLVGKAPKPLKKGGKKRKSKTGKAQKVAENKNPRARPLDRLKDAEKRRYLFITNAQMHNDLHAFCVENIGAASSAKTLPVKTKLENEEKVAPRLGVLEQMTEARLRLEIKSILSKHGHIQSSRLESTLTDLQQAVRKRLLKEVSGVWTSDDVDVIFRNNGGQPSPARKVVPPMNINEIRGHLARGAVILSGQAGTGKTIIAELLEHEHRTDISPFEIVGTNATPGYIRKCLQAPGRHLFFLEDPWGHYEVEPDADRWRSELPKLLSEASENKRFLVTTRSAIEEQAFRGAVPDSIRRVEVVLRQEHYSLDSRKEILTMSLKAGAPWQRDFAKRHGDKIVKELGAPFSLVQFAERLKRMENEHDCQIDELIRLSQMESISQACADEIAELPGTAVPAAIALWSLFTTRKIVTETSARDLGRSLQKGGYKELLDPVRLFRWLEKMGRLLEQPTGFSMHPTVMQGLEILVTQNPAVTDEVISARLTALASGQNGNELELLVKQIFSRQLEMPAPAQAALNRHLLKQFLESDGPGWRQAFLSLQRMSTGADPLSVLVRSLRISNNSSVSGFETFEPKAPDQMKIDAIIKEPKARIIAEQFIKNILQDDVTFNWDADETVRFFQKFDWDFSETFFEIAVTALKQERGMSISQFVRAALFTDNARFAELMEAALDAYQDAEKWYTEFEGELQRARQDELDADYETHVLEEPGEHFYPPSEALKILVALRRTREGYDWIVTHPRRKEILWAWAEAMSPATSDAELAALKEAIGDGDVSIYWKAVANAAKIHLAPQIAQALKNVPVALLETALDSLCKIVPADNLKMVLEKGLKGVSDSRKLDLVGCGFRGDFEGKQRKVLEGILFSPIQCAALEACSQEGPGGPPLNDEQKAFLEEIVLKGPEALGLASLSLLELPSLLTKEALPRFLNSASERVRLGALRALERSVEGIDSRAVLRKALTDGDYRCRQLAVELLGKNPEVADVDSILAMANDRSAAVRTACALAIGRNKWEKGLPILLKLIYDTQNSTEGSGYIRGNNANYSVARAAAAAFSEFGALPATVIESIIKCVEEYRPVSPQYHMPDIGVPYQLLLSICNQRYRGVVELYLRRLWDDWYVEGYKHSGYPIRIACALGLVAQLVHTASLREEIDSEKILEGACHDDDRVAGPCLLAVAMLPPRLVERIKLIIASSTFSPNRAVLLGAALPHHSEAWPALEAKLPPSAPLKKFLAWAEANRSATSQIGDQFLESNPDVGAWLKSIEASEDVFPVLRLWLGHRFGRTFGHVVRCDDVSQSHLPQSIPFLRIVQ